MLIPARVAPSSRRRPGVRRRPLSGRPTSAGWSCSRRVRRYSATDVTPQACPIALPSAWPCQYQDQPGLLRPIAREDHRFMTTTPDKATLPLTPGHWVVDTNHSSIGFTIRHLGVSKVRGRFTRFDADVVVGETLDTTSVRATIDVASIDTANADRDAHVLSPDLIDVVRRPTMVFRSTRVRGAGLG